MKKRCIHEVHHKAQQRRSPMETTQCSGRSTHSTTLVVEERVVLGLFVDRALTTPRASSSSSGSRSMLVE